MFKFAHSLSIALGFMVACVQGLCGAEKPLHSSAYGFTSDPRGVAKIYSQIFKNLTSKKYSSEESRKRLQKRNAPSSVLDIFCDVNFDHSTPFESPTEEPQYRAEFEESFTPFTKSKNFVFKKISKAHPIRAPSIA